VLSFGCAKQKANYNASYFSGKYRYSLRADSTTAYKLTFNAWDGVRAIDFFDDGHYNFRFNYQMPENVWVHITVTYAATGNTGIAKLYINGKHFETITQEYENPVQKFQTDEILYNGYQGVDNIFIGGSYLSPLYNTDSGDPYQDPNQNPNQNPVNQNETIQSNINPNPYTEIKYSLNGYLDELRFWKTTLDSAAIAANYDSYLSGKEADLFLYYRFNEPMVYEIFDISGRNGIFNENHGKIISSSLLRSTVYVPPCYNKATTDVNGNYLITTIPYTGEGSTAILKPLLGIHKFSPNN